VAAEAAEAAASSATQLGTEGCASAATTRGSTRSGAHLRHQQHLKARSRNGLLPRPRGVRVWPAATPEHLLHAGRGGIRERRSVSDCLDMGSGCFSTGRLARAGHGQPLPRTQPTHMNCRSASESPSLMPTSTSSPGPMELTTAPSTVTLALCGGQGWPWSAQRSRCHEARRALVPDQPSVLASGRELDELLALTLWITARMACTGSCSRRRGRALGGGFPWRSTLVDVAAGTGLPSKHAADPEAGLARGSLVCSRSVQRMRSVLSLGRSRQLRGCGGCTKRVRGIRGDCIHDFATHAFALRISCL
jgi:hypothetical protein